MALQRDAECLFATPRAILPGSAFAIGQHCPWYTSFWRRFGGRRRAGQHPGSAAGVLAGGVSLLRLLEHAATSIPVVRQYVLGRYAGPGRDPHHVGIRPRPDRWRLAESASLILENVQALGLRVEDIEVILNSHAHFDHAGGIAELQRRSGALVQATHASSMVLRSGRPTPEDPQRDAALAFPPVSEVALIGDGDTVRVGRLELVAHVTPGHSPGGTTWSWRACEGIRCLDVVYADSQTPVSDASFRFSKGDRAAKFERGLRIIEALSCNILSRPTRALRISGSGWKNARATIRMRWSILPVVPGTRPCTASSWRGEWTGRPRAPSRVSTTRARPRPRYSHGPPPSSLATRSFHYRWSRLRPSASST